MAHDFLLCLFCVKYYCVFCYSIFVFEISKRTTSTEKCSEVHFWKANRMHYLTLKQYKPKNSFCQLKISKDKNLAN